LNRRSLYAKTEARGDRLDRDRIVPPVGQEQHLIERPHIGGLVCIMSAT
jgi:hypothetical protein